MNRMMNNVVRVFKPDGEMRDVKGTDGKLYKLATKSRTVYEEVQTGKGAQLVRLGKLNEASELVPD